QATSQELVDANNAIMNPANFSKLHERMQRGAKIAMIEQIIEARELLGNPVDDVLVKEINDLLVKDNWDRADYIRFAELENAVLTFQKKEDPAHDVTNRFYAKEGKDGSFMVVDPQGKVVTE